MGIVWLLSAVVFGILEAATAQLVSVWFAGGAICALLAYIAGANATLQWVIFAVSSAIILLFTRPLAKKLTRSIYFKSNTDALIGKTAIITKSCDTNGFNGEAKLDGKIWTACSSTGDIIEVDSRVTVEKIEGVKLIVKKESVLSAK